MPDDINISAFIWYHADSNLQTDLLAWLGQVKRATGIQGRLLVRKQPDKTTYMEIYDNVKPQLIDIIEDLAGQTPCFSDIQRRCESFSSLSDISS